MNREILFRGQLINNKEWIFGCLISDGNSKFAYIYDGVDHGVIPETVGQFTGLTDTKGIKIFGDDLRKDNDGVIFRIYETYGGFIIKANYWKDDTKDLTPMDELIYEPLSNPQTAQWLRESTEHAGTIFDNPELVTP